MNIKKLTKKLVKNDIKAVTVLDKHSIHIEYFDGNKYWYKDGEIHRDDGPAVVRESGEKYWYKDGKLHRDGGPAIVCPDGSQSYYTDGKLSW